MKPRGGFTLIEVVIAMTILLAVITTLVTMSGKTVHLATTGDRDQAAIQLATDRIDEVRADPDYDGLDTLYVGTESSFATLPGFSRTTALLHVTADSNDYKRVTVTVSGPGLAAPVARTIAVGAP